MTSRVIVFASLLAICAPVREHGAQTQPHIPAAVVLADSVVTFADVMAQVRAYHPIARQAVLSVQAARADQRVARGGFDPTLSASAERKAYGGGLYYEFGSAKLTAPTPFGIDVQVGYDRALGRYLNPERRVPSSGLFSAGLRIPVGQRLLTDERRTGLVNAAAQLASAQADADATINKLLLTFAKDYTAWFEASQRARIMDDGVALAQFRLEAARRRTRAGETAAIDTVEARLEVSRRTAAREEAAQLLYSARLTVETHLWNGDGRPVQLPVNTVPESGDAFMNDAAADSTLWLAASRTHPDVRKADARLTSLSAARRLASQGLLPNAYIEMSALNAGTDGPSIDGASINGESKLSATLSQSLLLMRERGRAASASALEERQELEVDRVAREISAAVRGAVAELAMLQRVLDLQSRAVADATTLRDGEQRRFDAGESTLFLVNTRDRVVLDERLKLVAVQAKRLSARVALQVASGIVSMP